MSSKFFLELNLKVNSLTFFSEKYIEIKKNQKNIFIIIFYENQKTKSNFRVPFILGKLD